MQGYLESDIFRMPFDCAIQHCMTSFLFQILSTWETFAGALDTTTALTQK